MTHASPSTSHPSDSDLRPYSPPSVQCLGTIEDVTAGPNEGGGTIDQLFGGVGGFRSVPDTTS